MEGSGYNIGYNVLTRLRVVDSGPTVKRSPRSTLFNDGQLHGVSTGDDSPFIRPHSPSPPSSPPHRPSLDALKNLGSVRSLLQCIPLDVILTEANICTAMFWQMHAGTQTLIQAIQAYPWTDEPEGDDDAIPPMSINSDSSEEEQTGDVRSRF